MSRKNSKRVSASAPGKIIIMGEHFVVHGSYAVAAAINKRARVTVSAEKGNESLIVSGGKTVKIHGKRKIDSSATAVAKSIFEKYGEPNEKIRIEIESEIPLGSGLGSSAAVSVATAAAISRYLGHELDRKEILKIAGSGEKSIHGNPSGIDANSSMDGGLILYSRKSGAKPVPLNRAIQFLVVYSGRMRSTSNLISKVSAVRSEFPAIFDHLRDASSFASIQIVNALLNGDLPYLGAMMNYGQASLSWIGVSTKELNNLIEYVLGSEACYGAKITGAGGGGSIIALTEPDRAKSLAHQVSKKYPFSFIVSVPQEGLRWE